MKTYLHVANESPVRLWGLSSGERLERLVRRQSETEPLPAPAEAPADASVLLFRGDYLFEGRLVDALARSPHTLLALSPSEGRTLVAAHVTGKGAQAAAAMLGQPAPDGPSYDGNRVVAPADLCPPYQEQLLKSAPPFVVPIAADERKALESLLFGAAYKGITDLVTKWVWPLPARWGTALCARLGLSPNQVTALSWGLATVAGLLFWEGHYAWGLLLGWLMTYLDTVDGKLARVTVTSSRFGHLFDHILDLLHPPLWYLAWGLGLASYQPLLLPEGTGYALWIILGSYVAGRLVEGAFQRWLGSFGIFCWRRIDSYSRLVTARRNPCLILLTLSAVAGRTDLGLEAVAVWTLLSSLFLLVRLAMGWYARSATGPLSSWLAEIAQDPPERSLAVRWFAPGIQGPKPGESA